MISQLDWTSIIQQLLPGIVGLVLAVLGFIGVVLGVAALAIRSYVQSVTKRDQQNIASSAKKDELYLELVNDLRAEVKELKGSLNQETTERRRLDSDFRLTIQRADDLDSALAVLKGERDELVNQIKKLQLDINALKSQVQAREKELAEVQKERQEAHQKIEVLEGERQTLKAEIQSLRVQLAELEMKVQAQADIQKQATGEVAKVNVPPEGSATA